MRLLRGSIGAWFQCKLQITHERGALRASGSEPPSSPSSNQTSASTSATVSLILGLISWPLIIALPLFGALPGLILGKIELDRIERGESPEAGRTRAAIGFWASVAHIATCFLAVCAGAGFWFYMAQTL